jgi:hypothetical protein
LNAAKLTFLLKTVAGLDFEYYGAGIYLAPDSSLSNHYAGSSSCQFPSTRSMLLVRVASGKQFPRTPLNREPEYQQLLFQQAQQQLSREVKANQSKEKMRELLRKPANRSCPKGFHSQLGIDEGGGRKSKTELVVNRSYQCFPAYRITYRLNSALPKPVGNPLLKTLDEYLASEFHRKAHLL